MSGATKWYWVGDRADVLAAATGLLGGQPATGAPGAARTGDVVVVDARAGAAAQVLPFGHVFSGVRALKQQRGVRVFVVHDADDRVAQQLARFCLADGSLPFDPVRCQLDGTALTAGRSSQARPSIDDLLALDTGCVWGGCLTAARIGHDGNAERISVRCAQAQKPGT